MDKYEYRLKAEQIEKLVKKKDYKTAAKIADTIDWRRVKNLSMLYIVAEIYEELERYEDCMEILNIAYDRAPVGRMLLYKMTETATKMHNFEDAISLYREFVKLAPHDQSRYILKYQIYRERGSKIEDQIKILREYKAHEYQEKWAYELAECYAKAGMTEECVRECDELILWFSEGEYVAKAMELKMQFEPLTAAQQAQYDRMLGNSGAADIHEDDFEEQGVPTYNTDKFSTVNLQAELAANLDELLQSDSTIEIPPLTLPEPETPSKKEEVPQTEREEAEPEIRLEELILEEPVGPETEEAEGELKAEEEAEPEIELEELTLEALPVEPEREEPEGELQTEVEEAEPEIELEELTLETPPAEPEIELEELTLETPPAEPEIKLEELTLETSPAEPETQEPEDLIVPDLEAPEVEPIEKPEPEQPAGQMTIEDVLAEWENKKAETEAKIEAEAGLVKARREKVRQETAELMKLIAGDTSRLPRDVKEILDEIDEESRQKKEGSGKPEEPLPQIEPSLEEEGITLEELKLPEETKTRRPDGDSYARHKKNRVSGDTAAMNMIQELEKSLATEVSEMAVNAGHLTKEQARLFAYFTSVKGMSGQLAELFKGNVRPNRKNSSNGNLVITGKRGNGKTTLAIDIVKALQKQNRIEGKKLAKISGRNLNTKDVQEVLGKVKGGALIIENAGALSDSALVALSLAMEGDTGGLLIILEDSAEAIQKIFYKNKNFSSKFDHTIDIPVFTNDELIAFAKSYALELNCTFDEFGVLALYDRIGSRQTLDHMVSVAEVKDIVDGAISHAEKRNVRHLFEKIAKKNVDEFGNRILREEDFEVS
ncbi:hypothetical protein B5F29_00430 [Lachnoclostridium sp. An196]|uniref:hypothetical protein n=1 Tax=Lachnoclostridium sp. An196 TaxID=1965583 RepID=UPI000B3663E9|nr:hypothetical protein [Lachnoclostridium sp. An196]OUP22245.1 hypothetical protein B5F29_00430 [Lachnoclostridium sp. An196]